MHELQRVVLKDWGRLDPQDVDVRGAVAILGPTGAGKSTIVDALQVIVTGASSRYFDLNKSTGGHNHRTIREYCLGADDQISPGEFPRQAAETLLALVFRDRLRGEPTTIGLLLSANEADAKHEVRSRFVAPGLALSLGQLTDLRADGKTIVASNSRIIERLKGLCPAIRFHSTAMSFVEDLLLAMRSRGASPDARQVLRNFKESIAFQPIDDPTHFVRTHILEEDNIDVDGLKGSIERYRYLEQEVLRRERQLEEISEARRRLQNWAHHTLRINTLAFEVAHAERRRLDLVLGRLADRRQEIGRLIERELHLKRNHEQAIRQLEEDMLRQRGLLADAPQALQMAGLEAEFRSASEARTAARSAAQRRLSQLLRLSSLVSRQDRVPIYLGDALDAVRDLAQLARGKSVDELGRHETELVALESRAVRLVEAEQSLQQQLATVSVAVEHQKSKLDELERSLEVSGDGPLLSPPVRRFMALLAKEGISSTPLPDLVDVTESSWAMALEMLLGPNREALLVPRHQLSDAYSILYRERRELHYCRLVDTRKSARWQRQGIPAGSIAEIIETASDDARVFIESHVGRTVRAETDHDLEHLQHAVTRRGKTAQGMSLRVYRDLVPILGRTAQAAALEQARQEFAALSETQRSALADRDALQGALAAIAAARDDAPSALADALGRLSDAEATLRGVERSRQVLESPETAGIRAEIATLETAIKGYREEIVVEIEPQLETLRAEDTKLQVEHKTSEMRRVERLDEEEWRDALEAEDPLVGIIEFLENEEGIAAARNRVAVAAEMPAAGRDPVAVLATHVATCRHEAEPLPRLADESARRGRSAWTTFIQDHVGSSPLSDPDDLAMLRWARTKELQLQDDELRRFREDFEDARKKMEADLTEGLINRLSDKFQKARAQIDRLNRSLAGRRFTGQTYAFKHHLNAALKSIHALAEAIAQEPQKGLAVLDDPEVDPRARAGFKELERRLSDELLVKDLQDYRRFFDFDLHMTNERGQETTLSRRAQTGSGGQKQAPYYVAVAAAMAAAYFPKSAGAEPEGLGLVVFDEAFNNLDAPNTRALFEFFADLHLQVVVAAPDKVRAMFLETVDTVVSVNRRPDTLEPVITVTHPSQHAREALAEINPLNLGVEAFRPVEQAAE